MPGLNRNSLQALALAGALSWGMAACAAAPTDQGAGDLAAARPGGGGSTGTTGPKVTAVDPDTVRADTTLNIRVLGSGFTTGSQVSWALKGSPTTKVTTSGPVAFVSSRELVAQVTVAADAQLTNYDVVVTTSGGKKGIGIELLLVVAQMIPLQEPSGIVSSSATDVADDGTIVGAGTDASGRGYALRWTPSGNRWTVETLSGARVDLISDAGHLVRTYSDGPSSAHQSAQAPGGSEVHFDSQIWFYGVSRNGTLIGSVQGSTQPYAWRTSGSGWESAVPLPMPAGWTAYPNGISDLDDIAGEAFRPGDPSMNWAVVWRFNGAGWGPMQLVDTAYGGCGMVTNAHGAIAGCHWPCFDQTCASKAVFWAAALAPRQLLADPLYSINTPAHFGDMNNSDQIVGSAIGPKSSSARHAVAWLSPGDAAPLDLGLEKSALVSEATALNDARLAVGWFTSQNRRHAVAWRLP